jgi:Subtilase family
MEEKHFNVTEEFIPSNSLPPKEGEFIVINGCPLDKTPQIITEETDKKEYYIIVNNHSDLDSLYSDLEIEGNCPNNIESLKRIVECIDRSPNSRATSYNITDEEAELLKDDPRIKEVELHPRYRNVKVELYSTKTQYSSRWSKSRNTASVNDKNWGLLRCVEGSQTVSTWGGLGYSNNGANILQTRAATINLAQTGKNVDIIIVDDVDIIKDHPEFAVNADGTGGSRLKYYNWYQHNPAVTGEAVGTYPDFGSYPGASTSNTYHPTHVAGIAAGNTQGWARDANIYHIYFGVKDLDYCRYVLNYVKEFHNNKPINPETGVKNPTIINNSWGLLTQPRTDGRTDFITEIKYRGVTYTAPLYDGYFGNPITTGFMGGYFWIVPYTVADQTPQTKCYYPFYRPDRYTFKILDTYGTNNNISLAYTGGYTHLGSTGFNDLGATVSTTPTYGNNDDGYWTINLPFSFKSGAQSYDVNGHGSTPYVYNSLYVGTNGYITFEAGTTIKTGFGVNNPAGTKIMWNSGDRSIQRIFYVTTGTAPNRVFKLRIEGNNTNSGTIGSPGIEIEIYFWESPSEILNSPSFSIAFGPNNAVTRSGTYGAPFTDEQIASFGTLANTATGDGPARSAYLDADVEDLIKAGIIIVGAAGNSGATVETSGSADYDNYWTQEHYQYVGTYDYGKKWYEWRGSSPCINVSKATGGDYDASTIVVGSIDSIQFDTPAIYSNRGTGVVVWSPGTHIFSSYSAYSTTFPDPRNSSYYNYKISGTSMASPQVCGVLACALEVYPNMNQYDAIDYIAKTSKADQIKTLIGGAAGVSELRNGSNLFLYYKPEKELTGNSFPKATFKPRPTSGLTYPRTRIKRSK